MNSVKYWPSHSPIAILNVHAVFGLKTPTVTITITNTISAAAEPSNQIKFVGEVNSKNY